MHDMMSDGGADTTKMKKMKMKMKMRHHASSALYSLGFIGAAVYFISISTSFGIGVIGFLKALVWPAFLVYQAFQFLAR